MNREDTNRAIRLSLLLPDKRSDSHNVYSLRAKRQEREAQAQLGYAHARTRVEHVVPVDPKPAA